MGSYGRNFDFRIMPQGGNRGARYLLNPVANVPIGAPLIYDGGVSTASFGPDNAVLGVSLARGPQAPRQSIDGIGVYEYAPAAYAGFDPVITNYSDLDFIPAGKLCQVVTGKTTKVVFTNTTAFLFNQTRTYAGRTMVAGLGGATSTTANDLEPGVLLTPGAGTDAAGYWAVNGTSANAWLIVTGSSFSNSEVEAVMTF